jgi:hypothetical protein
MGIARYPVSDELFALFMDDANGSTSLTDHGSVNTAWTVNGSGWDLGHRDIFGYGLQQINSNTNSYLLGPTVAAEPSASPGFSLIWRGNLRSFNNNGYIHLVCKENTTGSWVNPWTPFGLEVNPSTHKIQVDFISTNGQESWVTTEDMPTGTDATLMATYDGTKVRLYVACNDRITQYTFTPTAPFAGWGNHGRWFAGSPPPNAEPFQGWISELRFFPSVKDMTWLQTYLKYQRITTGLPRVPTTDELVAYRFDEPSAPIINYGSSGSGDNLLLYGATSEVFFQRRGVFNGATPGALYIRGNTSTISNAVLAGTSHTAPPNNTGITWAVRLNLNAFNTSSSAQGLAGKGDVSGTQSLYLFNDYNTQGRPSMGIMLGSAPGAIEFNIKGFSNGQDHTWRRYEDTLVVLTYDVATGVAKHYMGFAGQKQLCYMGQQNVTPGTLMDIQNGHWYVGSGYGGLPENRETNCTFYDMRVWQGAKTAAELQTFWEAQNLFDDEPKTPRKWDATDVNTAFQFDFDSIHLYTLETDRKMRTTLLSRGSNAFSGRSPSLRPLGFGTGRQLLGPGRGSFFSTALTVADTAVFKGSFTYEHFLFIRSLGSFSRQEFIQVGDGASVTLFRCYIDFGATGNSAPIFKYQTGAATQNTLFVDVNKFSIQQNVESLLGFTLSIDSGGATCTCKFYVNGRLYQTWTGQPIPYTGSTPNCIIEVGADIGGETGDQWSINTGPLRFSSIARTPAELADATDRLVGTKNAVHGWSQTRMNGARLLPFDYYDDGSAGGSDGHAQWSNTFTGAISTGGTLTGAAFRRYPNGLVGKRWYGVDSPGVGYMYVNAANMAPFIRTQGFTFDILVEKSSGFFSYPDSGVTLFSTDNGAQSMGLVMDGAGSLVCFADNANTYNYAFVVPQFFPRKGVWHLSMQYDPVAGTISLLAAKLGDKPVLIGGPVSVPGGLFAGNMTVSYCPYIVGMYLDFYAQYRISAGVINEAFPIAGSGAPDPFINATAAASSNRITLTFSEIPTLGTIPSIPASWRVYDSNGAQLSVTGVVAVGKTVQLTTGEMKNGMTYTVYIPDGIINSVTSVLYSGPFAVNVAGVGAVPDITTTWAPNLKTVNVVFTEVVVNSEALDKSNYSISGGVTVTGVTKLSDTIYQLQVSGARPLTSYTITVTGIHDIAGNLIA